MKDLYNNSLDVGDYVIFKSDDFYTEIARVCYIGDISIQVMDEAFRHQIAIDKNTGVLPVIKLGKFINNKTTGDIISLN